MILKKLYTGKEQNSIDDFYYWSEGSALPSASRFFLCKAAFFGALALKYFFYDFINFYSPKRNLFMPYYGFFAKYVV